MFVKTALAAAVLSGTQLVLGQASSSGPIPLASQSFTYTNLPYHADPNTGERGSQFGYNICNSTTENQNSLCQTAIINSLDDFCLWGAPEPNSLIGNIEGEAVAWCTKPGHGTRLIPAGSLTGVQFMKTPDYVQVTGLINQAYINIATSDDGGELDPHGADQRGNPLGALLFSNAFAASAGNPTNYVQAIEWHNFMGGGAFCLKACDPSRPNAARYCEHVFDRIGCQYNAPAAYAPNVFESCLGDNQDFPGVYVVNGVTSTFQQPPESLGPISVIPYTARIPASSQCSAGVSSVLYSGAPSPTITLSTSTSTTSHSTIVVTSTAATTRATTSATTGGAMSSAAVHAGWIVVAVGAAAAALF